MHRLTVGFDSTDGGIGGGAGPRIPGLANERRPLHDGFLDEEVPVSLSPYECDELMNET